MEIAHIAYVFDIDERKLLFLSTRVSRPIKLLGEMGQLHWRNLDKLMECNQRLPGDAKLLPLDPSNGNKPLYFCFT